MQRLSRWRQTSRTTPCGLQARSLQRRQPISTTHQALTTKPQSSAGVGSNEDNYINRNGVYVSGIEKNDAKHKLWSYIKLPLKTRKKVRTQMHLWPHKFDVRSLHTHTRATQTKIVTITDHSSVSSTHVFGCEKSR